MYNLKEDPLETKDLSDVQKDQYNTLAKALRAYIQKGGMVPWQKEQ
ncbi:MAG: hypothetical protein M3342_08450 [Bacteroidota bacterium]|nr:hypothetical protein [Flavisolibacter sp.]MDQ3844028.1 hypothetical protein [Bacteroidota bacterium]MBD0284095.1 hypothetical protein [Flavisolibacter sp.]MBD0294953.1 hypothetical protein [Flavisolibacter sp.]MBD0352610.1 hypothetical protein [Flavisolibacter sp.]